MFWVRSARFEASSSSLISENSIFIDGAQAAPHLSVDIARDGLRPRILRTPLYGPTGIKCFMEDRFIRDGALPVGGGMISAVSLAKTTYRPAPLSLKLERQTLRARWLGVAIEYVHTPGWTNRGLRATLLDYAGAGFPEFRQFDNRQSRRSSILSFSLDGVHAHDAGTSWMTGLRLDQAITAPNRCTNDWGLSQHRDYHWPSTILRRRLIGW
jgi:selenocysteine lyase/cysteine desulfurase